MPNPTEPDAVRRALGAFEYCLDESVERLDEMASAVADMRAAVLQMKKAVADLRSTVDGDQAEPIKPQAPAEQRPEKN